MRILHLTGEYEDTGGVLSVIRNLQAATSSWGWQHMVWVNHRFINRREPQLSLKLSRHACADSKNHLRLFIQSLKAATELRALCRREAFDVIHAHTRGTLLVALWMASLTGRKIAFTNHNYANRTAMYRLAIKHPCIHMVLLTPNMARHYGLSAGGSRIRLIPACCTDSLFKVQPRRPIPYRPDHKLKFIGVGSLLRWKGWHLIQQALERLDIQDRKRLEFRIYGPTLDLAESRQYVYELQEWQRNHPAIKEVVFCGATNKVQELLRDADWFVLPSRNEPCSVALIEAMATGLPALTSSSGGCVDIVQNGKTGLFFEPDNPADLAAKIRMVLSDLPDICMPCEIQKSVQIYAASSVARKYAELYHKVLADKQTEINLSR